MHSHLSKRIHFSWRELREIWNRNENFLICFKRLWKILHHRITWNYMLRIYSIRLYNVNDLLLHLLRRNDFGYAFYSMLAEQIYWAVCFIIKYLNNTRIKTTLFWIFIPPVLCNNLLQKTKWILCWFFGKTFKSLFRKRLGTWKCLGTVL